MRAIIRKFVLYARPNRAALDGSLFACAFTAAYLIRFEGLLPWSETRQFLVWLPLLVAARLLVNWSLGVYRLIWRFVCLADAISIAGSLSVTTSLLLILRLCYPGELILGRWVRLPLSVITLEFLLSLLGSLSVRALYRMLYERRQKWLPSPGKRPRRLLLYGAGRAGMMLLRELRTRGDVRVIGFIDDDPEKIGTVVSGVHVLADGDRLGELVPKLKADEAVIAMATASRHTLRRILAKCKAAPVPAKIIPSIQEIVEGKVRISEFREVRIEDLLGRSSVHSDHFDQEAHAAYRGRKILVTGGGGSIGSELVRQLISLQPQAVAILDKDENSVYELEQELQLRSPDPPIRSIVRNVRHARQLFDVFADFRPQVVFHAAAHKHVPLMEHHPCEAILNNVQGTMNVLRACQQYGTERFVFISSDKAVNPTNIMGATKRIGEKLVQAHANGGPLCSACVRFGNVMGSRGSIIPLFERQIAAGGPVTITHPDIVRFFMTIPEAVQLVLYAGSLAAQGEVFVLDMGSPRRILDLAHEMVLLCGLEPEKDIQFSVTGLRPGEKMSEELVAPGENLCQTRFVKLFRIVSQANGDNGLLESVDALVRAAENNQVEAVYQIICGMGIGFQPGFDANHRQSVATRNGQAPLVERDVADPQAQIR